MSTWNYVKDSLPHLTGDRLHMLDSTNCIGLCSNHAGWNSNRTQALYDIKTSNEFHRLSLDLWVSRSLFGCERSGRQSKYFMKTAFAIVTFCNQKWSSYWIGLLSTSKLGLSQNSITIQPCGGGSSPINFRVLQHWRNPGWFLDSSYAGYQCSRLPSLLHYPRQ